VEAAVRPGGAPGPERRRALDPAPLRALVERLARELTVPALDELWIFPPRQSAGIVSAVVVASALEPPPAVVAGGEATGGGMAEPAPDPERRRVVTARYADRRDARGQGPVEETVMEHGVAPRERIARLIDGVVRRLDDELATLTPRAVRIGGDPARFDELLASLADPLRR
jgi:hypothetical protein